MRTRNFAILLALVSTTTAQTTHQSGGAEHIVLIDSRHPTPPAVSEVLQRLQLSQSHPDVAHVFNNSAFSGFAASMKSHCLDLLANMSDVALVEKSSIMSKAMAIKRQSPPYETRSDATWGLSRISSAYFKGSNTNNMDYTYSFADSSLGRGSDIYIVDSGIWTDHEGFEGRAKMIYSFDGNMTDTDGHGTHVAGTAGGVDFGVASNANLFGVRVLDDEGQGSTATVIAGIDYIVQQHDARKTNSDFVGSVISISLAASGSVSALDQAIAAAVSAGIHTCVAAGNDKVDACTNSPSSSGGSRGPAITVGSVGISGQRSSFSNYGDCVDVYAPGENILSAGMHDPLLLAFLSGTSQATPHVTGIVAYAMASNKTLASDPALMKEWIRMTALPLGDGTVLANNGVGGNLNAGMIGYNKQEPATENWSFISSDSDSHSGQPGKRDTTSDVADVRAAAHPSRRALDVLISEIEDLVEEHSGHSRR